MKNCLLDPGVHAPTPPGQKAEILPMSPGTQKARIRVSKTWQSCCWPCRPSAASRRVCIACFMWPWCARVFWLQSNHGADCVWRPRPAHALHVYSCNTIVILATLADGTDASFARCSPGGDHVPAGSCTGVAVLWRVDLSLHVCLSWCGHADGVANNSRVLCHWRPDSSSHV